MRAEAAMPEGLRLSAELGRGGEGRFVQADSIIPNPGDPASYDRYSYRYGNPVKYIDPTGHTSCIPKQCGYTHAYDEAWSQSKSLFRLRSLYGEFAEGVHIDDWDPSYNPEADPYLPAAREGDNAGIWASDVSAIDRRAGWDRDPQGTAKTIFVQLLAGIGEGISTNIPQLISAVSIKNIALNVEEWVGQGEPVIGFYHRYDDFGIRNESDTR